MFEGQVAYKVRNPDWDFIDKIKNLSSDAGIRYDTNHDILSFDDFTVLSEQNQKVILAHAKKHGWKDVSEVLFESITAVKRLIEKYTGKKVIFKEHVENPDYDVFYEKLVPSSGPADTLEGELLRAVSKISYRYYNDGDYYYTGYGAETAGSSAYYLLRIVRIPAVEKAIAQANGARGREYERCLQAAVDGVVDFIKSKNGQYTPNTDDNLNYHEQAINRWGDDDNNYEDDDYDDDDVDYKDF